MIKIYALIIFIKEYLLMKKNAIKNSTANSVAIFRVDCMFGELNCH